MARFTPDRWRELGPHLDRALDLAAADRAAWLAGVQTRDPGLAADLEVLLAEHQELARAGFLEQAPIATDNLRSQESASPGPLSGCTLGGFRLRELVGSGGFGDVYLAEQTELQREAVVKVLRSERVNPRSVQRFLGEAQLASRLDHPYVAHVYDFGADADGVCWIAMERVRGSTLRALLQTQGPLPLERFVPLLERICEVVHSAHEQGIVHRDLKPENIMVVARSGRLLPKLLDLGIAQAVALPEEPEANVVVGSPAYLAPECWNDSRQASPRSDQYALGALAYEAITGRKAFAGGSIQELAQSHRLGKVEPLGSSFPPALDRVLRRALDARPERRYANVLELAQAFRQEAAASAVEPGEIPRLDEELRQRFVVAGPQPLAEAIALHDAARNPQEAQEALGGIVEAAAWYVGLLVLGCRARVGSGGRSDTMEAQSWLRRLHREGLDPGGWVALARALTLPFAELPDAFPLPELVLLLHPGPQGADPFAACLTEPPAAVGSSRISANQASARSLPALTSLLRSLLFLTEFPLLVAREDHAESWMGLRGRTRAALALPRDLVPGRVALADPQGAPLVQLWPLMTVATPVPSHAETLFLLAGPGAEGARSVSLPDGFEHQDPAAWDWFREHLLVAEDPASPAPAQEAPYRGLAAYTAGDAAWFFGREAESSLLANRLRIEPFLAIVGPSGVGKSSFAHAGVARALEGWTLATFRPGRSPFGQLVAVLERATERAADGQAHDLLVVVDQFEEVFTLGCPSDERVRFVALLLAAVRRPRGRVRVLITLRDDFLVRTQQLRGMGEVLARGLYLLGPLSPEALQRALVEPARRAGYDFEDPELPARMVSSVGDTPAAVALLSFAAEHLWELRDRHFRHLPRRAYEAIGGVGGALAGHAERTLAALPGSERGLARRAFRHLVTTEGTRAVLERAELEQLLGGEPAAARLVERLIDARLVTAWDDERLGGMAVELVHEALLEAWPRLAAWRREDFEGARLHEQLRSAARQWSDRGRPAGLLWRSDALVELELWRRRHAPSLTPIEAGFADASAAQAIRGRNLRRGLLAVVVLVSALFTTLLWRANRTERGARREAVQLLREFVFEQGRRLAIDGNKGEALSQLRKAHEMGEASSANRLLLGQLERSTRPRRLSLEGHTGPVTQVSFSRDGRRILSVSADGTARVWETPSGRLLTIIRDSDPILNAAMDPGGDLVVTTGASATATVWEVSSLRSLARLWTWSGGARVAFTPDGSRILTWSPGGLHLKLWTPDGRPVADVSGHFLAASFCGQGRCLATVDDAGVVELWDIQDTTKTRWRFQAGAGAARVSANRAGTRVAAGIEGSLVLLGPEGNVLARRPVNESISGLVFSPDDRWLVTWSNDRTARIWSAASGEPVATLSGHRGTIWGAMFSPASDKLVTFGADRIARLWTSSGVLLGELAGHESDVVSGVFSEDGQQVLTGSFDHRAIIWDVERAIQFRPLLPVRANEPNEWTSLLASSPDGTRIALAAADGRLAVQSRSGAVICRSRDDVAITRLAWSPDGAHVATVGRRDQGARIWDAASCEQRQQLGGHEARVSCLAYLDASTLASGDLHGVVRLSDVKTGASSPLRLFPGAVIEMGLHPAGDRLFAVVAPIAGDSDGQHPAVFLQDLSSPQRRLRLEATAAHGFLSVAFDRRRNRAWMAGESSFQVWDDRTGQSIETLKASPSLALRSVLAPNVWVSPDEKRVVRLAGASPSVWDADTLAWIGDLKGHTDLVTQSRFLQDDILLTASEDGTARVWDLVRLLPLMAFDGVRSFDVSPDRSAVVLAGPGGTRLWIPDFGAPPPPQPAASGP